MKSADSLANAIALSNIQSSAFASGVSSPEAAMKLGQAHLGEGG